MYKANVLVSQVIIYFLLKNFTSNYQMSKATKTAINGYWKHISPYLTED